MRNMKKIFAWLLVVVLLVGCFSNMKAAVVNATEVETQTVFNASEQYALDKGNPNGVWTYQSYLPNEEEKLTTLPLYNNQWWGSNIIYVQNNAATGYENMLRMVPELTTKGAAVSFTAPYNGTIKIAMNDGCVKSHTYNNHRSKFLMLKNGETMQGYPVNLGDGTTPGSNVYTFKPITLNVQKGDIITFAILRQSDGQSGTSYISPIIAYTEIEGTQLVFNASEQYALDKGNPNGVWMYQAYLPNEEEKFTTLPLYNNQWWGSNIVYVQNNAATGYENMLRMVPELTTKGAAVGFTAPYSGEIEITMNDGCVKSHTYNNHRSQFLMLKNGETLEGYPVNLGDGTTVGSNVYTFEPITLNVQKGDTITFAVLRQSDGQSGTSYISPIIAYTKLVEDTALSFPSNESITISDTTTDGFTMTWPEATGGTEEYTYTVYTSETAFTEIPTEGGQNVTGTSYTWTGLTYGKTYYAAVVVSDGTNSVWLATTEGTAIIPDDYVFNASEQYALDKGNPNGVWTYQSYKPNDKEALTALPLNQNSQWWGSNIVYVQNNVDGYANMLRMVPELATKGAAVSFTAPYSGEIEITMNDGCVKSHTYNNHRSQFLMLKNGETLEGYPVNLGDGTTAGSNVYTFEPITSNVQKGDTITFAILRQSDGQSGTSYISPIITYNSVQEDNEASKEEMLTPIWEGDTVYYESVMALANEDGTISPISLAYPIESIVSVKDSSLSITYEENVDYKIEDGKLVILTDGAIPVTDYDDYYMDAAVSGASFEATNGGYLYFAEGSTFHKKQIAVTYTHSSSWQGEVPKEQADRLDATMEKLENKEALNIVFYGDSITVGANSSSFVNAAPYLSTWTELVVAGLKAEYGYNDITSVNTAVGGKGAVWGLDNIQTEVIDKNPDLVFIGFGMNDSMDAATFSTYITNMITAVRASNPDCEFVLVAPMLPNEEVKGFYHCQDEYAGALDTIAQSNEGIAVADVTAIHSELLEVKRYYDMTGNNVNHPNDFLARIYAQVALSVFDEKEYESYSFVEGYKTDSADTGIWRYYVREVVKNKFTAMTFNAETNRWEAPAEMGTAYIWEGAMHPSGTSGATYDYQTVLQFVAPKSGTIEVSFPGGIKISNSASDGVRLSFWANGTGDQRFNGVLYQTGTTEIQTYTVEVTEGQILNFLLHRNGNNAGDSTVINPTITYTAVIEADPVRMEPSCVTLSFYDEDSIDYGVSWNTPNSETNPIIQVVKKTSDTPDFSEGMEYEVESVAFEIAKLKHQGLITGLDYDTTYYYRVGDKELGIWSEAGQFTTREKDVDGFTFLHVTDTHDWNYAIESAVEELEDVDFMLHTGDFVDDFSSTSVDWAAMLDTSDVYMNLAIQIAAGNHDPAEYAGEYFKIDYEPDSLGRIYYSFDYGDVHFVVLDTGGLGRGEVESINEEQMTWLKQDLSENDTKWTIIGMHKTMYSVGPHGKDADVLAIREQLAPLMDEYEVDLVLSGHDHVYMRTPVMKDGKPDYSTTTITEVYDGTSIEYDVSPDGTVYIIPGASGLKQYARSNWDSSVYYDVTSNIMKPVYAAITIEDDTLTYRLYTVDETTYKSTLYDSYGIIKEEEAQINALKTYNAKDMENVWSYFEYLVESDEYKALMYDKSTNSYVDSTTEATITATSQTTTNTSNVQTVRKFTAPYTGTITVSFEDGKAASSDITDLAYLRVWRGADRTEEVFLQYLDNSTTKLKSFTINVAKGEELYFVVGSLSEKNTIINVTPIVSYTLIDSNTSEDAAGNDIAGSDTTENSGVGSPGTGDDITISWILWLAVSSSVIVIAIGRSVRRRRNNA